MNVFRGYRFGGLVVFTDDAYAHYHHLIDDRVDSRVEIASDQCVNSSSSSSCCADSGIGLEIGEGSTERIIALPLHLDIKYS